MNEGMNDCMNEWLKLKEIKCMNEWMNEIKMKLNEIKWMNEWMNERN